MIVTIFMTSLITVIVLLVTSAIYIVKVVYESTEDVNSSDSFTGIEGEPELTHTFNPPDQQSRLPSVSAGPSIGQRQEQQQPQAQSNKENVSSITSTQKNVGKTAESTGSEVPKIGKHLFDDFDQREVKLGGTGLHWCKSRPTLENLIKIGIPIDAENARQETALHVAVRRKKLPILIGLLCYGADLECRNENGETALLLACRMNDIYACQLLLVFDASVDALDNKGNSPRHYTAAISARYKKQKLVSPLPVVSDVILAMLHEMGARRCAAGGGSPVAAAVDEVVGESDEPNGGLKNAQSNNNNNISDPKSECPDGCSPGGSFDGNSHNRWSDFKDESFHREFMFKDLIEARLRGADENGRQTNEQPRRSRILCIDGGGMRGVIVCQIMIELGKYLKRPLLDYFDWIGGTSVGAFLSCSLCTGKSLFDLRRISFCVKDEVFSGQKPYESSFLERVLKRTMGPTTRMFDVKDRKLAVTTVIADREPCQLMFFRNYKSSLELLKSHGFDHQASSPPPPPPPARDIISASQTINASKVSKFSIDGSSSGTIKSTASKRSTLALASKQSGKQVATSTSIEQMIDEHDPNPLMWQAVRASAAAPFFFKPYGPYLDGGIISNNPTLDIMAEFFNFQSSRAFLRKRLTAQMGSEKGIEIEQPTKLDFVLSLGTGRFRTNPNKQAMIDLSCVTAGFATVFSPVELVKSIRAIRDLFKKMLQQSCQTEDHIVDRAQGWCASLEVPYYRINPPLASIFSIDDKRDEQLINALWQTKLYMMAMKGEVKQLADLLEKDVYL